MIKKERVYYDQFVADDMHVGTVPARPLWEDRG